MFILRLISNNLFTLTLSDIRNSMGNIFQDYFSCCSIQDCASDTPQGYNKKDCVAIKSKCGNQLINYEK